MSTHEGERNGEDFTGEVRSDQRVELEFQGTTVENWKQRRGLLLDNTE
jgi:hypothetical protein